MILYTFFKSALTKSEQTYVDKHYIFSHDMPKHLINIDQKNYLHCQFCDIKKFKFSSHCKTCRYCVLRRDHHCAWIGNCVGFHNNQLFINLLIWTTIGSCYYFNNLSLFYENYEIVYEKYKFEPLTYFDLTFITFTTILQGFVFIGTVFNLGVQLHNCYSGIPLHLQMKTKDVESYIPCLNIDNSRKKQNEFNKGFICSFFYLIGPTLFHIFLPIYKENRYDIVENNPIINKNKAFHGLEMMRHLYKVDKKNADESYQQQIKNMDPNNYLERSRMEYENVEII